MADIKALVLAAIDKLDTKDDTQWTSDGVPKMDVMQRLTDTKDLTRAQLNEAAPGLTRQGLEAARNPPQEPSKAPTAPKAPDVKHDGSEPSEAPEMALSAEEEAAQRSELQEAIAAIDKRVEQAREHVREVHDEIDRMLKQRDELAKELEQAGVGDNADAIREYIVSSHRARAAARGVCAPIDQALKSRKRPAVLHRPTAK